MRRAALVVLLAVGCFPDVDSLRRTTGVGLGDAGMSDRGAADVVGMSDVVGAPDAGGAADARLSPEAPDARLFPVRDWQGHMYLFGLRREPWTNARDFCSAYGYQLVTIDDAAENAWIAQTMHDALAASVADGGYVTVWTGLNDLDGKNVWSWVDGSQSTYRNWLRLEFARPRYGCGIFYARFAEDPAMIGKWADQACELLNYFVCEVQ